MIDMKRFILLAALALLSVAASARKPIRVACVGDSITYGAGIEDRSNQSYPADLQRLLGDAYDVRNFGSNARIMMSVGDYPYWNDDNFAKAVEFLPDVVIIMLGTNDTKPHNWNSELFPKDYDRMVRAFKALDSHPDIFVCCPPAVITDRWGINEKGVVEDVIPVVGRVARHHWLDVIDNHSVTAGRAELYTNDGVHPNPAGAQVIAENVYSVLAANGYGPVPGERVLFIGDSITDGDWGKADSKPCRERTHYDMNHIYGHGYPEMTASYYLAKYPARNMRFYNRGIGGNRLMQMSERWDGDVLAVHPDVVSVLIGINDIGPADVNTFDFAGWEATYRSLIARTVAADPEVKFVLCTPFVTDSGLDTVNPDFDRRHAVVERMASVVRSIAADNGCACADYYALIESLVAGDKSGDHKYWMWDGIHPTTQAHQMMSQAWIKAARKAKILK